MNIQNKIGELLTQYNHAGLAVILAPVMDVTVPGADQQPELFRLMRNDPKECEKLRAIRTEAVKERQLRVLYLTGIDENDRAINEVDVCITVEFGTSGGTITTRKFRICEERPAPIPFSYTE